MSKIVFPEDILKKMVCRRCDNFLSLFPINIKKNTAGALCGRCRPSEKDSYIRDVTFEALAKFLIFPCAYAGNGCPKNFAPDLLKEHEPCCEFRKIECPNLSVTKCTWEGSLNALFQHFEEEHSNSIIYGQVFKIDFSNSITTKFVMKVNKGLCIVKKDIDIRKESFCCTVEYLGSQKKNELFNYVLKINGDDNSNTYICGDRVADGQDATKLTANFLREKLGYPHSMLVTIEVFKNYPLSDLVLKDKVDKVQNNPEIDWHFLSEFECPICLDYMVPPIYQCLTGHSICKDCKPKVSSSCCPTCEKPFKTTQNFSLEKMTKYVTYPCKNYKLGCGFAAKTPAIATHEKYCDYRSFECPLKDEKKCQWLGAISDVPTHIESNHEDSLLKNDRIEVPYHSDGHSQFSYLLTFDKRVFKLLYIYDNYFSQWSMQIVGSNREFYYFEIDIFDATGGKKRLIISGPVMEYITPIDFRNCLKLADETVSAYAEKKLTYFVRVFKS